VPGKVVPTNKEIVNGPGHLNLPRLMG